jgi:hypothetical protein
MYVVSDDWKIVCGFQQNVGQLSKCVSHPGLLVFFVILSLFL